MSTINEQLLSACEKNDTQNALALLNENDIDVNVMNTANESAFLLAMRQNNTEIVNKIVDSGKITLTTVQTAVQDQLNAGKEPKDVLSFSDNYFYKAIANATYATWAFFKGALKDDVLNNLTASGMNAKDAKQLCKQATDTVYPYKKHVRRMLAGLAWFVGGLIFTLLGYQFASSSGGGTYAVFWGAMVIGGIQALWGLIGFLISPKSLKQVA
ncbi:MAG: hypothetical protein GX556_17290 [Fibrobacter sp.]|nr:hypothetical protein [Fibrobacter sp.]